MGRVRRWGGAVEVLEQLEDGEHDVVDVAEAGCLSLLCVVQPARPVQHDVGAARGEAGGAAKRAARVGLAVLPEAVKDGAVLVDAEALKCVNLRTHIVG